MRKSTDCGLAPFVLVRLSMAVGSVCPLGVNRSGLVKTVLRTPKCATFLVPPPGWPAPSSGCCSRPLSVKGPPQTLAAFLFPVRLICRSRVFTLVPSVENRVFSLVGLAALQRSARGNVALRSQPFFNYVFYAQRKDGVLLWSRGFF